MHIMGLLPKFQKKGTASVVSPSTKSSKKKPLLNSSDKERELNKKSKNVKKSSHKDIVSSEHHLGCDSYNKYLAMKKLRYQMWVSSEDRPKAIKELISCNLKKHSKSKPKSSSYSMYKLYICFFFFVHFNDYLMRNYEIYIVILNVISLLSLQFL